MNERQLEEKGLCGFAIQEGSPPQPKRFAAAEEGCRAHGYCNLVIFSTGDEREAYTHVGNLVTYAQGAWIGLLAQQVFLGAVLDAYGYRKDAILEATLGRFWHPFWV